MFSALPSRLYQDFGSGEVCSRSGAGARPGSGCVASGQGFTSLSLSELLRFSGRSWRLLAPSFRSRLLISVGVEVSPSESTSHREVLTGSFCRRDYASSPSEPPSCFVTQQNVLCPRARGRLGRERSPFSICLRGGQGLSLGVPRDGWPGKLRGHGTPAVTWGPLLRSKALLLLPGNS